MLTTAPRGTKDILPRDVEAWRYLERTMREICAQYGYLEIRTPVFEHTELFLRGIGETTDVVEKEMYTFTDRGERSLTLRPENTASAVRSYVENKMYADPAPTKLFYIGPMFRYDRPQAGRYRQFHQFGVEALGVEGPNIDAEIILLAVQILQTLGLKDLKLKVNSVGCPKCRPLHREKLQEYFRPHLGEMCKDCQSRFDRNPLRLLDCKNPHDQELAAGAPSLEECLCEECKTHFEGLKELLTAAGVDYVVDHNLLPQFDNSIDVFVVCPGSANFTLAFKEAIALRREGLKVEFDFLGRSMKAQMKQANRLAAKYVLILGEDEVARGCAVLRNMSTSEQTEIPIQDITSILKTEVQSHE